MAEKSDGKKGSKVVSKTVNLGIKIARYAKYLANPVVLYALLIIIIIIYIIGAIGFFMGLPGSITGWISDLVQKLKVDNIMKYDVKDEEILNLAKQLEEMGYDLENYGFIDTIKRKEAIEGNTYLNNTPQKGEVEDVTSKYLTAYLGEEKKMYKIAPENYNYISLTEDYYLLETIKKLGDETFLFLGGNDSIQTYYKNLDKRNNLNDNDKKLYDEGKALATYYFYYIKGTDIYKLSSDEQTLYEKRKESNVARGYR